MIRKLLYIISVCLLLAVLTGCSAIEEKITDRRAEKVHAAFDSILSDLTALISEKDYYKSNDLTKAQNRIKAFDKFVSKWKSTNGEEIDALEGYLNVYLYEMPVLKEHMDVGDYKSLWEEHLKDIPEDYDGYYALKILLVRAKIKYVYDRIIKAENDAPLCAAEGCSEKGDVEADSEGHVYAHKYCWSHKCLKKGCGEPKKTEYYCVEHSPHCRIEGCTNLVDEDVPGCHYCTAHKCAVADCPEMSADLDGTHYCLHHYREFEKRKNSGKSGSSSYGFSRKNDSRNDPFDVYDFDDPDDFADEWAEEFGEGDFEDGWDDAWDYWQDSR